MSKAMLNTALATIGKKVIQILKVLDYSFWRR
jgi:hypothetical protein